MGAQRIVKVVVVEKKLLPSDRVIWPLLISGHCLLHHNCISNLSHLIVKSILHFFLFLTYIFNFFLSYLIFSICLSCRKLEIRAFLAPTPQIKTKVERKSQCWRLVKIRASTLLGVLSSRLSFNVVEWVVANAVNLSLRDNSILMTMPPTGHNTTHHHQSFHRCPHHSIISSWRPQATCCHIIVSNTWDGCVGRP